MPAFCSLILFMISVIVFVSEILIVISFAFSPVKDIVKSPAEKRFDADTAVLDIISAVLPSTVTADCAPPLVKPSTVVKSEEPLMISIPPSPISASLSNTTFPLASKEAVIPISIELILWIMVSIVSDESIDIVISFAFSPVNLNVKSPTENFLEPVTEF